MKMETFQFFFLDFAYSLTTFPSLESSYLFHRSSTLVLEKTENIFYRNSEFQSTSLCQEIKNNNIQI